MLKTSFILLGVAGVSAGLLMAIAGSVGTDEAISIGILFEILFPLLLIAAATAGLVAFVFQKPRKSPAYLAVALPLLGLALFAYIAIPQVRKPILEMRAKAGDVDAQYELGGKELVEDMISPSGSQETNRFYWLTKAAQNGRLAAQLDLGRHYLDKRNYEMAERWLKPIADSTNDGWERLNARNDMDVLSRLRGESLEQKSVGITNTSLEISH